MARRKSTKAAAQPAPPTVEPEEQASEPTPVLVKEVPAPSPVPVPTRLTVADRKMIRRQIVQHVDGASVPPEQCRDSAAWTNLARGLHYAADMADAMSEDC